MRTLLTEGGSSKVLEAAERIAQQKLQEAYGEIGPYLRQTAEGMFDLRKEAMAKEPYFEKVQDKWVKHFEENPQDKLDPIRLRTKYNELVGEMLASGEIVPTEASGERRPANPLPTAPPPSSVTSVDTTLQGEPEASLDDREKEFLSKFNQAIARNARGAGSLDAETFRKIQDKEQFHTKGSTFGTRHFIGAKDE